MLDLVKDTSGNINSALLQFQEDSMSLESFNTEFRNFLDHNQLVISVESYLEPDYVDQSNPFLSMEEVREGYASTSASQPYSTVASGLVNKTLSGASKAAKSVVKGTAKGVASGSVSLVKAARSLMEKMTTLINSTSTMISKMLASGYPLMGKLQQQAEAIKKGLEAASENKSEGFELPKGFKFLAIGNAIPEPKDIIKHLDYVNEVQKVVLSKAKLEKFKDLSSATLEPFRSSIKQGKTDTVVFIFAILAAITNPGVPIGMILKKIFSAANPQAGEVVDKVARISGGMAMGIGALALTAGASATSYMKQMSIGKLDISALPRFNVVYPFCNQDAKLEGIFVERQSELMLGNRHWVCRDYTDELTNDAKGSVANIGAKFIPVKVEGSDNNVAPLSKQEVSEICDAIISMMANARAYCQQWPTYAKTYNQLYRQISDIVMTYEVEGEDGKKSPTAYYTRYAYRNAMNTMLGGMWTNCFGADNQFTRYLVGLCRTLLQYCQQSIQSQPVPDSGQDDT